MDQGAFILLLLIIGIIAVASFTQGTIGGGGGPIINPPNPKSEFGVVHEQRSFFFSPPPSPPRSNRVTPLPPPPAPQEDTNSLLQKNIYISNRNTRSNNPDQEYIDITYSGGAPLDAPEAVNISAWTVSNKRGGSFTVGVTTNLPGVSSFQNQDQLILKKGGTVHIVTGRSPLGVNFRLNICEPYFNQFHTFTPRISVSCPSPSREPGRDNLNDQCYQFVTRLTSCQAPFSLPLNLNNECRDFINTNANYNGCVNNHKYDSNFYRNEWWAYLNQPLHIWSDIRDAIILRNERGVAIASLSYQ